MNVVLDTNVIVSGLLDPFSPPGEIVRMVSAGALRLCMDPRVISEYRDVLNRKRFRFDPEMTTSLLDYLQHAGTFVSATPLPSALPDPDDEPFVEVALAGRAQCLVTGNLRHFPKRACQGLSVLSPAEFIEYYKRVSRLKGKSRS
jgi:putative PIN family toxin of toxin-antitoxin system